MVVFKWSIVQTTKSNAGNDGKEDPALSSPGIRTFETNFETSKARVEIFCLKTKVASRSLTGIEHASRT
jgi:hypothetical protein